MDVQIAGFLPDQEITFNGAILGGASFVPTTNGIGAAKKPVSVGLSSLPSACLGAAALRKVDDTKRIIVGTSSKLYEASSNIYTDLSKIGGYAGNIDNPWRFDQYGNDTIATNLIDPVQVSSGSTFANLAGSPPKAAIVAVSNGFVMLFNYNDGINAYADGWWCSGLYNSTTWTPSIATQAANGRLLDTAGSIRAAKLLGNVMVVYKERSMYLGFYDGAPIIWRWQLVAGEIGAVSQEAVANVIINGSPVHIFAGFDDIYIFDGSRPISIGIGAVREWYNMTVPAQYRYRIKHMHDRTAQNVWFFLPDSTGALTYALVYNYIQQKYGLVTGLSAIEAVIEYLSGGVTYDGMGNLYSTYDSLPAISYDSPYWTSGSPLPAAFDSTHTLNTFSGTPATSNFQMAYIGDLSQYQTLTRIRPMLNIYPASGSASLYTTSILGSTSSSSSSYPLNNGKIDLMKSSRWFSVNFSFTGEFEMVGYNATLEPDGEE